MHQTKNHGVRETISTNATFIIHSFMHSFIQCISNNKRNIKKCTERCEDHRKATHNHFHYPLATFPTHLSSMCLWQVNPVTLPDLVLRVLVSSCFNQKLSSCGVVFLRGKHERCDAILYIDIGYEA